MFSKSPPVEEDAMKEFEATRLLNCRNARIAGYRIRERWRGGPSEKRQTLANYIESMTTAKK